jgi:hypothetical protein
LSREDVDDENFRSLGCVACYHEIEKITVNLIEAEIAVYGIHQRKQIINFQKMIEIPEPYEYSF